MAVMREAWGAAYVSGTPEPTFRFYASAGALATGMTHTRASSATYWDASMVLQTAGTNTPRFTYWPGVPGGPYLLREQAATNLFLNSATGVTQNITVTAVAHTLSFLGTGTITLSGVSTAGPLVGTGTNDLVQLNFTPTAGVLTLTVTGTCTHVQLEIGVGATSRIVTAGTTVTRAVDGIAMPTGCVDFAGSTVLVRCARMGTISGNNFVLWFGQNTVEVMFISYTAPSNTQLRHNQLSGGVTVVNNLGPTTAVYEFITLCASWGGGVANDWWNGTVNQTDASAPLSAPGTPVYALGGNNTSGNAGANILVAVVELWRGINLNDAQMQRRSTLTG